MRLPKWLHLGYKAIKVLRKDATASDDDAGTWSDCRRELYVNDTRPEHEQGLAFLHELVHAYISEADIELDNSKEEAICEAVSRGLAETIMRNPGILKPVEAALK